LFFLATIPIYSIPTGTLTVFNNSFNQFLLLNNEFRNQTWLNGFVLNAAVAGSITIQVISTGVCGNYIPCAVYFTQNPFNLSYSIVYTWNYNVSVGYNQILLPSPVLVNKGNFLNVIQITGYVACNQTANSTYSDLFYNSTSMLWQKLSRTANWRLIFTTLTNFTSYQSSINIMHTYSTPGLYLMNVTFASAPDSFIILNNITQCKYIFITPSFLIYLF